MEVMATVRPILDSIVAALIVPVTRHLDFLVSSSNHVRNMHTKLRELNRVAHALDTRQMSNHMNGLVVPDNVPEWLEEVQKIKLIGDNIPIDGVTCLNMKMRYKVGKQSFYLLKDMEHLINEKSEMEWTDEMIPLAIVSPPRPTTSTTVLGDDQNRNQTKNNIKSRDLIFNAALKSLDPSGSDKQQKIALCGMGGIGKTTMMEQLKKVAKERKMFDLIVKVDVGKNSNIIDVQNVVSEYTGRALTERTKDIRAERLQTRFKEISDDGKKKILVILDNVWEEFDLKDIGLTSPLPFGFRLLITSREETVCIQMGVEANSIFRIGVLEESEAKSLFLEIVGLFPDNDSEHDLHKIGEEIVKGCGGLPIAIKTVASGLRDNKEKYAWAHTLSCLQNKEFNVHAVFKISYENLKNDYDKSFFLLSGLLPNDCEIGTEELLRYGWGLNLFKNVNTLAEARNYVNTSVYNLIHSNLLIKSDYDGCFKMHDLVHDFVLSNFTQVKQASIVNYNNNVFEQLKEDEAYERILLKCGAKVDFPESFNHPNLALLVLMGVDKHLKFSKIFYTRLEKLTVVVYENIRRPLLPQYLTNLQVLSLRSCMGLLHGDLSFLGDLVNLEVLSLAHCGIHKLPSNIGKLKRLKLLDLSGCIELCIDDGVFQDLEKLEELYLSVFKMSDNKDDAIRFTFANRNEFNMLLRKLSALEVEYFENIAHPKYVSFEKLERFRISMGCLLRKNNDRYSFKNTLKLVTNKKELLEYKIDELFHKTEVLDLEVNDMNYLEDVLTYHPQRKYSFFNLKELCVSNCASLTFLFTSDMTKGFPKLEILKIKSCFSLKSVVYCENRGSEVIKFDKLKLLSLEDLPELVCLCDHLNVLVLPQLLELCLDQLQKFTSIFPKNNSNISTMQPLLNIEVEVPKLEKLEIARMNNLKEIWSFDEEVTNISMLRQIIVRSCDSLVNLFPSNPMRLLCNFEELRVARCASIKELFNLDLGKVQHVDNNHSCLRVIEAVSCKSLREVWNIKDAENNLCGFHIRGFETVDHICIEGCDRFRNIVTPSTATFDMGALNSINITIIACKEYDERSNGLVMNKQDQEVPDDSWSFHQHSGEIDIFGSHALTCVVPYYAADRMQKLQKLNIDHCSSMRELFETKEINITNIDPRSDITVAIPRPRCIIMHKLSELKILKVRSCGSLENVFTVSTFESMKKLEQLSIRDCKGVTAIVREEYNEQTSTSSSKEVFLPHLKSIELHHLENLVGFFLGTNIDFHCPLLDYVMIDDCPQMVEFTSGNLTAQRLKHIHTNLGEHILESGLNFHVTSMLHQKTSLSAESISSSATTSAGRTSPFHNVIHCRSGFKNDTKIFPSNELQQLQRLETIHIRFWEDVEEVFEVALEVPDNESQTVIKFPNLREVKLCALRKLKCIWKSNQWRKLEFANLTRLSLYECTSLEHVFTCSMVHCVKQLQELHIEGCVNMKTVVKEEEEDYDAKVGESIEFPFLKSIQLEKLYSLKGFFLGKEDLTLPILDTLEIIRCPKMTVFSEGRLVAPKLTKVETSMGFFDVEEDVNSFIMTTNQEISTCFEDGWRRWFKE